MGGCWEGIGGAGGGGGGGGEGGICKVVEVEKAKKTVAGGIGGLSKLLWVKQCELHLELESPLMYVECWIVRPVGLIIASAAAERKIIHR